MFSDSFFSSKKKKKREILGYLRFPLEIVDMRVLKDQNVIVVFSAVSPTKEILPDKKKKKKRLKVM